MLERLPWSSRSPITGVLRPSFHVSWLNISNPGLKLPTSLLFWNKIKEFPFPSKILKVKIHHRPNSSAKCCDTSFSFTPLPASTMCLENHIRLRILVEITPHPQCLIQGQHLKAAVVCGLVPRRQPHPYHLAFRLVSLAQSPLSQLE